MRMGRPSNSRLSVRTGWGRRPTVNGLAGGCRRRRSGSTRGPAGTTYPWGESDPTCTLAQYADCEGGTVAAGGRPEGASWCGALDMAGNVWEWVADWYGPNYYDESPSENPTGPESGQNRVLRGGSWCCDERYTRGAGRYKLPPVHRIDYVGFRCVVVPE